MDKSHEVFLREAISLATQNIQTQGGGPFGAVIVKNGEVIAKAVNTVTTTNDPTAHAEVNAIRLACNSLNTFDLSGCVIYASCEPCPMCLAAIFWARIDKIFYAANRFDAQDAGFDDSFFYEEIEKPLHERVVEVKQILHVEGQIPLRAWVECETKTPY